jgi:hypothetical protein
MNRSVRNGLAIAGMAGGIFFLGQAVASASDGQAADAGNNVEQSNSSTDGGGGGLNGNLSEAEAKNVEVVEVETDVEGGDGGLNQASVNTGVIPGNGIEANSVSAEPPSESDGSIDVDFHSGDVSLTQEANGGDVNGSGNVHVADTGGDQTAIATNNVSQSNTSEGDDHDGPPWHEENGTESFNGGGGGGHDDDNVNLNGSSSEATNVDVTEVETDIEGGDGGTNQAEINTGIIGGTFYCPEYATCTYNFTTGDVTVYQSANGGDVNGSGNVNIGGAGRDHHAGQCGCPKHEAEAPRTVKPVSHAAPVAHKAPALSSAQPSGALAFTGSDVSVPLTVGLIALGLGVGLTALGRRREIQTA